ncbi:MAG: FapA family protein [Planctomycetota bacterium]|nr:FapA family protein [Planctomycetota bacterium]
MSILTKQLHANAPPPALCQCTGRIRLLPSASTQSPAHAHAEKNLVRGVLAGEPVATLLPPGDAKPENAELGPNTELAPDGSTILATASGIPSLRDGRLWIDPAMVIPTDAGFDNRTIQSPHTVIVRGNALDLAIIHSGGSIRIAKIVEAAQLQCAGDLIVGGGIAGKEKGHCIVGRNLHARFATNANLDVRGDLFVDTEIVGCRVRCGGQIIIEKGTILAGQSSATSGIRCRHLGGAFGARTVVEAGGDSLFFESAAAQIVDINKTQIQICRTRQLVDPLMKNQKWLSPQQKEKATELLFQVSELEEQNAARLHAIRTTYTHIQEHGRSEIHVTGVVYPGVVVHFPGLEATISTPIRGPLCIMVQEQQPHQRRIVFQSSRGRSAVIPIETRPLPEDAMQAVRRLLAREASEITP